MGVSVALAASSQPAPHEVDHDGANFDGPREADHGAPRRQEAAPPKSRRLRSERSGPFFTRVRPHGPGTVRTRKIGAVAVQLFYGWSDLSDRWKNE